MSSMGVTGRIDGARQVQATLAKLKANWSGSIAEAVVRLELELLGMAQAGAADQFHGNGKLARNIHGLVFTSPDGNDFGGGIDAASRAVQFHELGFAGTETVGEHLRTMRQVYGRPVAPFAVDVAAHSASFDYPAHSFMRAALEALTPKIEAALGDTVEAVALKGFR